METLLVIIGLILLVVLVLAYFYSRLRGKRTDCREVELQVRKILERRHSLVTNLVDIIKSCGAQNNRIVQNVISTLNVSIRATGGLQITEAENALAKALDELFGFSRTFPRLQVNQNYAQLVEEIRDVEENFARASIRYNDLASAYNRELQKFPCNVVSRIFRMRPEDPMRLNRIVSLLNT